MLNSVGRESGPDAWEEERSRARKEQRTKHWLPKFSRSAIDCFRSTSRRKRKPKSEERSMAEIYYSALQSELGISNPYLSDGRSTPNAEIYRRSWKLDPFPALPGEKKRRCRSESNVARNAVASGQQKEDTGQKNWLKESKMKLEELFRRKYGFFAKKRTDSLADLQKHKAEVSGFGNFSRKQHVDSRSIATSNGFTPTGSLRANGAHFSSIRYEDDTILTGSYPHGCDPHLWRDKLERWAASLQCAIEVIKREEILRQEINKLRMHREALERQLEEISIEKERWRRKCIQLQKEKRRSVEGAMCRKCGGVELQFGNRKMDNFVPGLVTAPPLQAKDPFLVINHRRNFEDDELFKALHDLLLYNA